MSFSALTFDKTLSMDISSAVFNTFPMLCKCIRGGDKLALSALYNAYIA